jgi:hypothetical protein
MDVGAILNLDGFSQALDQSPKFAFHVVLGLSPMSIQHRVKGHFGSKIILLEAVCFLLELLERVDSAFFKPELACADQALGAVPVILGDSRQRRIKTVSVVTLVATVANKYRRSILRLATNFAFLSSVNSVTRSMIPRFHAYITDFPTVAFACPRRSRTEEAHV